jgi:hypothetical protein
MSAAIPPLPQYSFMVWCLVTAQGQLYLYLTAVILQVEVSGLYRRAVLWYDTNVLEVHAASIFTQKMEAAWTS